MPYNLLLLPLIGGFLFVHLTHFFRFGAQRLDGYRLLFQSAIAGICLASIARIVDLMIGLTPVGAAAARLWFWFSPFNYSGVSALALLMGPAFALLVNLRIDKKRAKDIEIRRHGNSLIRLLHRAEKDKLLLSITLDSRKWYVGWVAESPNLDPQEFYFRLLPFISGYRDKDTLETFRLVFYQDVLRETDLEPEQFYITLPLKDVKMAGLFNDDVYNEYFAEPEDDADPLVPSIDAEPSAARQKQR
ncbi:MAG TPA: hypothetical protein VK604_00835 [Bryobacteraceae bacterium]|nr:hypothetical protein [Bryobacteraceae bacterium]